MTFNCYSVYKVGVFYRGKGRVAKEKMDLPSQLERTLQLCWWCKLSSHDGNCRPIMEAVKVAHCCYVQARFFSFHVGLLSGTHLVLDDMRMIQGCQKSYFSHNVLPLTRTEQNKVLKGQSAITDSGLWLAVALTEYLSSPVYRLHTAFLHWPLSSAATKEVQGPDTTWRKIQGPLPWSW
jgi:hypothetical protein